MNFCDIDTSNCSWGGTGWRQTLKLVAVKFQIELRVVFILCNILIVNNHHLRTSTHFIWKNNEKEHCFVRLPRVVKTNSWHINFNTPQNRIYLISSKQCKDFLGCFIYFYNKRAMKETIIVEKNHIWTRAGFFFSTMLARYLHEFRMKQRNSFMHGSNQWTHFRSVLFSFIQMTSFFVVWWWWYVKVVLRP